MLVTDCLLSATTSRGVCWLAFTANSSYPSLRHSIPSSRPLALLSLLQVAREGTKKTVFTNFMDLCKVGYGSHTTANNSQLGEGKGFLSLMAYARGLSSSWWVLDQVVLPKNYSSPWWWVIG